jgi:hypothetical protein
MFAVAMLGSGSDCRQQTHDFGVTLSGRQV